MLLQKVRFKGDKGLLSIRLNKIMKVERFLLLFIPCGDVVFINGLLRGLVNMHGI